MSYEIPILQYTLIAGADLSTKQYKAAVANGAGQAVLAGANAPRLVGVIQNKPALGVSVTLMALGISRAICGATPVTPGPVATDANGDFIPAGANPVVGYALEGAAAGEHFPLLLS